MCGAVQKKIIMSGCSHLTTEDKAAALVSAVKEGHEDSVDKLINVTKDFLNEKDGNGDPLLVCATKKGHFKCAEVLIRAGADVNLPGKNGETALSNSAAMDNNDCVKSLIQKGADVNTFDLEHIVSPLNCAIACGQTETMKTLLNAGADLNTEREFAALRVESKAGDRECVILLLQVGEDIHHGDVLEIPKRGYKEIIDVFFKEGAVVHNDKEKWDVTVLIEATKEGHTDYMRKMQLGAGINRGHKCHRVRRVLVHSIEQGHNNSLRLLVELGGKVNIKHELMELTPLGAAVQQGQDECVQLLLKSGASPTGRALAEAVVNDRLNCMKILLDAGADVNEPSEIANDDEEKPALIHAAKKGLYKFVELLIQAGADLNAISEHGSTAIVTASQHLNYKTNESVDHGKCVNMLIDEGADVNKNVLGNTALSNVVHYGRDAILKSLIEAGADVNIAWGRRGNTPLITAIEKYHIECVKQLISARADVNASNKNGATPLHVHLISANNEHHQCLNLFLDEDAVDVNAPDQNGNTPLMNAAKYCHLDCLRALLQAGADVNKTNSKGSTALNGLASRSMKCIDVLTGAGADVNISENEDKTPIMTAATSDNKECIQKLLDAGADLNAVMKNGSTAVFFAATNSKMMVTKFLYMKGILINRKNNEGKNSVDFLLERLTQPITGGLMTKVSGGHVLPRECNAAVLMVMIAAGEYVNPNKRDIIAKETRKSECIDLPEPAPTEEELQCSLKQISRQMIRTHLLDINPHENLLVRVPKLHLPSLFERYLLYGFTASTENV